MFELSRQIIGSSHVPAWNWDAHRRRGNGNLSSGITNTRPGKGIKKKEGKKRARANVCKFRVKGPWPRARSRTSTFVAVIYNNINKILDTFIIIMKKNTFDFKKKRTQMKSVGFLYYSVRFLCTFFQFTHQHFNGCLLYMHLFFTSSLNKPLCTIWAFHSDITGMNCT